MDTALYVGLAQRTALRRRMDVVAHNVANMSTTAFNKERVVFRQHLVDAPNAAATRGGKISYVLDHGIVRNLEVGTPVTTNNPLDIFISKGGYLAVEGQNGDTLYTRNGRMRVDTDNFITLLSGERVLDTDGNPIQLENGDTRVDISEDGTISNELGTVAQLNISTFASEQSLQRVGTSLYETDQDPLDPVNAPRVEITQKAYESSNVNAIESTVEMIDVLRTYQQAEQRAKDIADLREDALRRLSRVQ
ncbi:flagellar hook basal-body protein [Kordiimonas sp. SCSIO 12610]|uniref:flagellar hook basal-body protein n=1 Tax=Kordiimonas sp. SCSIO 12610 TaxID=2829597 RepID=UPI00210A3E85|nr:flagellar hook basal-body protein [Kordiimonas sp. SCSIO 12610]UTW54180.1 flagellar hook basal-body protein [Kordiimonas sp. SCSIO 12610]